MAGLSPICEGNGGNKSLDFESWQVNIIITTGRILSKSIRHRPYSGLQRIHLLFIDFVYQVIIR